MFYIQRSIAIDVNWSGGSKFGDILNVILDLIVNRTRKLFWVEISSEKIS